MPKNFICVLLIAFGILFSDVAAAQKIDKDLKTLSAWMTGSFDTFAQVDADEETDARYRHIRATLQVLPVKISGLQDALALYVENAAAEARQKPYRQRVYVLKRENGKIIIQIYKIDKPEEFINAHKNPKLLDALSLQRLTHEKGCDMIFERINSRLFRGAAGAAKTCKSTLRGATHTVSNTEITPTQLTNLDQGFDDAGNHKWGPPPGVVGHIFVKRKR